MNRFINIFGPQKFKVIGMVHVGALPGTPSYRDNWSEIVEKAKYETSIYAKHNVNAVLIENMHDVPYVPERQLGPETVACLTRIGNELRQLVPRTLPCGIQILACGNRQALAVAKASNLQFIRAEGFVFGHVADEGYTDACAGELLRYRKQIDAEEVLVFTDLKKKHSSHAITQDVSLFETAKAAEFFLTDGIFITGNSTGHAASMDDVKALAGNVSSPLLIGSGVTQENVAQYFNLAHGAVIGSHFKVNGHWANELCEARIGAFMQKINMLRKSNHL